MTIYKCEKCTYLSDRKANIARHTLKLHGQNINESVTIFNENVTDRVFQCEKCSKTLSSNQNYKTHIDKCMGIYNALQCPICDEIFNNRTSKSRHVKACNERSLITAAQFQSTSSTNNTIINNTTVITGDQNNTIHNTIINQTNNIILKLDSNKLDEFSFVTDHITNPELKNILKITHQDIGDAKKVNMLEIYMRHLLSNPINQCIQKTNMQNGFSKIHTGENNWEIKHDKELYPKLTCNVAQGFSGLMVSRNDDAPMIKTERKLEELKAFLEYMTDEGYRNDSDENVNHQTHQLFKQLVQRIKGVVFEVTKVTI